VLTEHLAKGYGMSNLFAQASSLSLLSLAKVKACYKDSNVEFLQAIQADNIVDPRFKDFPLANEDNFLRQFTMPEVN
jgi:hypothetical protein